MRHPLMRLPGLTRTPQPLPPKMRHLPRRLPGGSPSNPPPGRTLRRRRPSSGRWACRPLGLMNARLRGQRNARARRPGSVLPGLLLTRRRAGTSTRRRPGPAIIRARLHPAPLPLGGLPGDPMRSGPISRSPPGRRWPGRRTFSGPPTDRRPSRPMPTPMWTSHRPALRSCTPEGTCSATWTRPCSGRCRRHRAGTRWRSRERRGRCGGRSRGLRFGVPGPATVVTVKAARPVGGCRGRPLPRRWPPRPGSGGGGLAWWRWC
jgi:hypothetical protein